MSKHYHYKWEGQPGCAQVVCLHKEDDWRETDKMELCIRKGESTGEENTEEMKG